MIIELKPEREFLMTSTLTFAAGSAMVALARNGLLSPASRSRTCTFNEEREEKGGREGRGLKKDLVVDGEVEGRGGNEFENNPSISRASFFAGPFPTIGARS